MKVRFQLSPEMNVPGSSPLREISLYGRGMAGYLQFQKSGSWKCTEVNFEGDR